MRSYYGTFAWVSCPLALLRWQRDYANSHLAFPVATIPPLASDSAVLVSKGSAVINSGKLYLEDLDLDSSMDPDISSLTDSIAAAAFESPQWQAAFHERFAIVSDDIFTQLAKTATEVSARIRVQDNTKTVQKGGLWYEEAIPAESLFSCPLLAAPRNGTSAEALFGIIDAAIQRPLQIGGNASVGRGLVELRLLQPEVLP